MGAVWGDYDNDGYPDLLLYKWGKPELFHNDHGQGFTRVTARRACPPGSTPTARPGWTTTTTASWTCSSAATTPSDMDLWHLKTTRIMPDSFEYANNGGRKYLLHNNGDGTFHGRHGQDGPRGRTSRCGHAGHGGVAADLRGTGYPDIILANDYGCHGLLRQPGRQAIPGGRPAGVLLASDRRLGPKSGMNASVGDVLNQGRLAVYVSNISSAGQPHPGQQPVGAAAGRRRCRLPQYLNMATDMGVDQGGWSFGAQFGDLNNDGNLDLFLADGYISADRDKDYWYDYGKITGGEQRASSPTP